jgi:hypothetical protein
MAAAIAAAIPPECYPADWLCVPTWFVGAEFDEDPCDFAAAFWFAELGPEVTPPAEIVTGAFPFTGVCCVADEAADIWAVSDFCAFSCAAPAPPHPTTHDPVPPTDCACFDAWFVGAEFHESACDFASAFWFAELGPEVTSPAEIVTGAFPFTGVCFVADFAAEACAVSECCAFSCAPPAPPHPPLHPSVPATFCSCEDAWFVGAEFDEPAFDFAAAFWFAELGPEVTSPAEIVTGAFPFTGVCSVADSAAETCSVLDSWPFACAAPAPPQPAAQTFEPPTDCACVEPWFVGAEFDESAFDFAPAFWFAELGPAVTPPAEIVTGALPFTGVCCTADVAADTCAATAAWMDAWSAPAPPFSADATAGTATAAATVATNAISFRFITPPSLVVVQ